MPQHLPLLPEFAANYIQNWADKRQPEKKHQQTINRHRLYILPTRHGILYFIVLLLILFSAINYENNLGFMLAFLLGSLGFLGMIYTHQNINQLTLTIGQAKPVFVGQDILFPLHLSQSIPTLRANIKLQSSSDQTISVHLINQQTADCKLPVTTTARGYININRIKLFSEYPLGLFHAWSWLNLSAKCLVYPEPSPQHHNLINMNGDTLQQSNQLTKGMDDFSGIRQYQPGDQKNHMAWKAIAKTGKLQTKLFNCESSPEVCIAWSQTDATQGTEKRLSILCRQIIDASRENYNFSLHIPGCTIASGSGLQHKHNCLKSLALFGQAE